MVRRQYGNIGFVRQECCTSEVVTGDEVHPGNESGELSAKFLLLFINLSFQAPESLDCWAVKVEVVEGGMVVDFLAEVSG